jgi:hypothetical protein
MAERYDENLFLGYVEGDLPPQDAARFEALMAQDARLRSLVAQIRADRQALRSLPLEQAPAELLDRVTAKIERHLLLGDPAPEAAPGPRLVGSPAVPDRPMTQATAGPRQLVIWRFIAFSGIAAALVMGAVVAWNTLFGPPNGVMNHGGPVGPLAMKGGADPAGQDGLGLGGDATALSRKAAATPVAGSSEGAAEDATTAGFREKSPADDALALAQRQTNLASKAGASPEALRSADAAGGGQGVLSDRAAMAGKAGRAGGTAGTGGAATTDGLRQAGASRAFKGASAGAASQPQVELARQTRTAEKDGQTQLALLDHQVERVEVGVRDQYARLNAVPREEPANEAAPASQAPAAVETARQQARTEQEELKKVGEPLARAALKVQQWAAPAQPAQTAQQVAQSADQEFAEPAQTVAVSLAGPRIEIVTNDVAASQRDVMAWSRQNSLVCVPYTTAGASNGGTYGLGGRRALDEATPADAMPAKPGSPPAPVAAPASTAPTRPQATAEDAAKQRPDQLKKLDLADANAAAQIQKKLGYVAGEALAAALPGAAGQQVQLVVIPSSQVPQLLAYLNARPGQRAQFVAADTTAPQPPVADSALAANAATEVAPDDARTAAPPAKAQEKREQAQVAAAPAPRSSPDTPSAPPAPTAPPRPAAVAGQPAKAKAALTQADKALADARGPDGGTQRGVAPAKTAQDLEELNAKPIAPAGSPDEQAEQFIFGHQASGGGRGAVTTPIVALTDTNWSVILNQQLPLGASAPLRDADTPMTVPVVIQLSVTPTNAGGAPETTKQTPAEPLPSKAKAR